MEKQYAERNIEELEPHYMTHAMAMTVEKLHSKMQIAAELACRDQEIERLKEQIEKAKNCLVCLPIADPVEVCENALEILEAI